MQLNKIPTKIHPDMATYSCGELCSLFCCPPCPAQIASKLAFIPPEPTYGITSNDTGNKYLFKLNERAEWQYSNEELENIEVGFGIQYYSQKRSL